MARRVLNVGGNNKGIPLPSQYAGWEHVLLDIDPRGNPDVLCDARELKALPAGAYDSIYCSHNLEHYHRHEVTRVVAGFLHLLKSDGFAFVRVPDMAELMQTVVKQNLDIDDVLYQSPVGAILVRDVIYGYGREIQDSGNDFYAHKTGFTNRSLQGVLLAAGFSTVFVGAGNLEVTAVAVKGTPTPYVLGLFDLQLDVQPGENR
jgi:predicted SAM-dependent methyltransferase